MEELWEAVFSVGPCRGYTWGIETQLSQLRVEWKSSLEAGSLRESEAENITWHRCGKWRSPHCCKSLHSNAESCCETDASLGALTLRDQQCSDYYQATTPEDTAD
jgi:hypothetical protein